MQQHTATKPVVRLEVHGRLTRITLELRDLPRERRDEAIRAAQGLAAFLAAMLGHGLA